MARRRNNTQDTIVDVVEAKERTTSFLEDNQNTLLGVLAGIVLVIGGFFAYKTLIKAPKEKEASAQMQKAQTQFERDSFALALTNPGDGFLGFLDIADQYSGTEAGNAALYYAGISYLNIGEFDAAISYMEDFSAPTEEFEIMKYGVLGDAYSELGQMDKATSSYKSAVGAGSNEALTTIYLKKLAMLSQKQGNTADAVKYFQQIKEDFPGSAASNEVDKYLARLSSVQ